MANEIPASASEHRAQEFETMRRSIADAIMAFEGRTGAIVSDIRFEHYRIQTIGDPVPRYSRRVDVELASGAEKYIG